MGECWISGSILWVLWLGLPFCWIAAWIVCCLGCYLWCCRGFSLVCCISCGVGIIQNLWLGWIGGLCYLGGLTCGDLWLVPPRWFG